MPTPDGLAIRVFEENYSVTIFQLFFGNLFSSEFCLFAIRIHRSASAIRQFFGRLLKSDQVNLKMKNGNKKSDMANPLAKNENLINK